MAQAKFSKFELPWKVKVLFSIDQILTIQLKKKKQIGLT